MVKFSLAYLVENKLLLRITSQFRDGFESLYSFQKASLPLLCNNLSFFSISFRIHGNCLKSFNKSTSLPESFLLSRNQWICLICNTVVGKTQPPESYFNRFQRNLKTLDNFRLKWVKRRNPAGIFLLKVNNRNTRTRQEICSNFTIKTPTRCYWRRSIVFIVNFEYISQLVLVFLLLTLNM